MRFVSSKSPLQYRHGHTVHRLALVLPEAGPPAASDTYFAPTVVGKDKRQIPGASDGVIAFIDWHEAPPDWEHDIVYIDYMKTRRDQSNRGYATQLMREFYKLNKERDEIDWGQIESDYAEKLFHKMKKTDPRKQRAKLF